MSALPDVVFDCPKCDSRIEGQGELFCPGCSWVGQALVFQPIMTRDNGPVAAVGDDAICVHHPAKRAEHVCAGSGDFICGLCAVEMNNKMYSANFLEKGGKDMARSAFDRYLPRPDRMMAQLLLISVLFYFVSFLTIPISVYYFAKARSQRKKDPLYKKVFSRTRMIVYGVICGLFFLGLVVGVIVLLNELS